MPPSFTSQNVIQSVHKGVEPVDSGTTEMFCGVMNPPLGIWFGRGIGQENGFSLRVMREMKT